MLFYGSFWQHCFSSESRRRERNPSHSPTDLQVAADWSTDARRGRVHDAGANGTGVDTAAEGRGHGSEDDGGVHRGRCGAVEGADRSSKGIIPMTHDQLSIKIAQMKDKIRAEQAKNKGEEQFQELFLAGLDILGELFLDIKRIADKS